MTTKEPGRLVQHWRTVGAATADPSLCKSDTSVLWSILQMINSKTGVTFPSLETIARTASVSTRTVPRSVKRLCERGYLHKTIRKGRGIHRSNVYRLGAIHDRTVTDSLANDGAVTDTADIQSVPTMGFPTLTDLSYVSASNKNQSPVLTSKSTDDLRISDPIWGAGLAFLERKGVRKERTRALLGTLRKELGPLPAAVMLRNAELNDISEPESYFWAAINNSRNGRVTLHRDDRSDAEISAANQAAYDRMEPTSA